MPERRGNTVRAGAGDPAGGGIDGRGRGRPVSAVRLVLWGAALVALLALARYADAPALLRRALDGIAGLGAWGPPIFVALYVLATVLFLPGWILTLGAGAVYGVIRGFILVSIAATLGATAAFLVGRYLARGWVAGRIEGNPRFQAIDEAVGREGWKIVLLTRLSPAFPFNLLNYAFGLTRLSLRDYVAGLVDRDDARHAPCTCTSGRWPGDLASLGAGRGSRTPAEWALYAVGLLATVAVTVYVTRIARRALERRIAP